MLNKNKLLLFMGAVIIFLALCLDHSTKVLAYQSEEMRNLFAAYQQSFAEAQAAKAALAVPCDSIPDVQLQKTHVPASGRIRRAYVGQWLLESLLYIPHTPHRNPVDRA
jgi:hypothetical protein